MTEGERPLQVSLRAHPEGPLRCAVCHDAVATGIACEACGTTFHAECRSHLGRCPTLGCRLGTRTSAPPVAAAAPPVAARARPAAPVALPGSRTPPTFRSAVLLSVATGAIALFAGAAGVLLMDGSSSRWPVIVLTLGLVGHAIVAPTAYAVRLRRPRGAVDAAAKTIPALGRLLLLEATLSMPLVWVLAAALGGWLVRTPSEAVELVKVLGAIGSVVSYVLVPPALGWLAGSETIFGIDRAPLRRGRR